MRHRQSRLRLRQKPAIARSLERNLVTSVLLYESVRTTKKRALVTRPIIEKLITAAKTKSPQLAIRYINRVVTHRNASRKLMEVLKQRYADRTSGFTRIVPLGARHGDGAKMVTLELTGAVTDVKEERSERKETKETNASRKTKSSSASSK